MWHTTASLRQLRQPQQGIVTWDRLEGNVAVPALLSTLPLFALKEELVFVNLLRLLRGNDTDLIIISPKFATRVGDRVNV